MADASNGGGLVDAAESISMSVWVTSEIAGTEVDLVEVSALGWVS